MIELFTNGMQLKVSEIKKYDGQNLARVYLYLILMFICISMVLLLHDFNQIKLSNFSKNITNEQLVIKNYQLNKTDGEFTELNRDLKKTGITLSGENLKIQNIGNMTYHMLADTVQIKGDFQLIDAIKVGKGRLLSLWFLTLYLKTFPFIITGIITFILTSLILTRDPALQNRRKAIEMNASLISLPAFIYLILKATGLRNTMALFIFVTVYVLIAFYYTRMLHVTPIKEDKDE
ncbi:hypothetical protein [Lapidilactobacillus bayanensis]|uniref:hypothetical protein n=1 Tax=Lapidilactobacillus bayanensis TaxID=2485998 RepID=UPI000F794390|nr:hypothetical protein [Lapidilactobacillus bayanensis]